MFDTFFKVLNQTVRRRPNNGASSVVSPFRPH